MNSQTALQAVAKQVSSCFHCGEDCSDSPGISGQRNGKEVDFCCFGCQAVSELIFSSGLGRFYQFREGESSRPLEDLEPLSQKWETCDDREELWGEDVGNGLRDLLLQTEGVHCAACAWLIRSHLEPLSGIERVQVDIASGYTRILWNPEEMRLSDIARELARLGYQPHLPLAADEERGRMLERRNSMIRLGVSGLGMMQVMMYAVGLYAGESLGISRTAERFLEWTSLLVTIPVVFFAGKPFFTNALSGLRHRKVGMDVPVALAIAVAFTASCFNFLRGAGDVYFDSVVMFIFFLSAARYIQMVQRHRSLQGTAALARLLPEWAVKVTPGGAVTVLASDLEQGDIVRVAVGEPFPADGHVQTGSTQVDEALLTGESTPRIRLAGDAVVAGSINLQQPVELKIQATGSKTALSAIGRMVMQAGQNRSRMVSLAENIAGKFVVAVLLIATATAIYWTFKDAGMALPAALAVLVISCPCALSLATPVALAAAGRSLMARGVLNARASALETLQDVDVVVFDKTGTLTAGAVCIDHVDINTERSGFNSESARQIAASLESGSTHPLANAFRSDSTLLKVVDPEHHTNQGMSGSINGENFRIGSAGFTGVTLKTEPTRATRVWLADEQSWIACFHLVDAMRPGAAELIAWLKQSEIQAIVSSGDTASSVEALAGQLQITQWHAGQTPQDKMDRVRRLQEDGKKVLMVGDGVNDAPVLAAADLSMTVSGATDLANSTADFILTGQSLEGVRMAIEMSRRTRRIIVQNLGWAITYNVLALPLAVIALLQPWMAALGMSLSSLLVVLNATRLGNSADPAGGSIQQGRVIENKPVVNSLT